MQHNDTVVQHHVVARRVRLERLRRSRHVHAHTERHRLCDSSSSGAGTAAGGSTGPQVPQRRLGWQLHHRLHLRLVRVLRRVDATPLRQLRDGGGVAVGVWLRCGRSATATVAVAITVRGRRYSDGDGTGAEHQRHSQTHCTSGANLSTKGSGAAGCLPWSRCSWRRCCSHTHSRASPVRMVRCRTPTACARTAQEVTAVPCRALVIVRSESTSRLSVCM
jgi:hypothetical protein